jgi:hypothetical protein
LRTTLSDLLPASRFHEQGIKMSSLSVQPIDADIQALRAVAQTYFDALYEMDADKLASIFHPMSSLTNVNEKGELAVTGRDAWLEIVRTRTSPKAKGSVRDDQILCIDINRGELALLKVKCQVQPRYFIDMLVCMKMNGTWKIAQKVYSVITQE